MPLRNRGSRRPPEVLEWTDPHCLIAQIDRHLDWLTARGFAASTTTQRRRELIEFCRWCEDRAVLRPPDLSRVVIDLYQKRVAAYRKRDGAPLSLHSQSLKLVAVATFCKWLARERLVLYNPASELELPRRTRRLPHAVLTTAEVEKILAVPDLTTPLGLRDRAMLEVFYSTAIRRSELARLAVHDIDFARGVLIVRQGKWRKDRFVPIGERALAWVVKYLEDVRPELVGPHDDRTLFLTADGTPFGRNHIGEIVRNTIRLADIGKQGGCHLFRHTAATLMLEGGADIRYIQQMLGHASLDTTQLYTQVSIHQLKAVHDATHPGAKLRRRRAAKEPADDDTTTEDFASDDPTTT
jgi:integrase/recombinase XerD